MHIIHGGCRGRNGTICCDIQNRRTVGNPALHRHRRFTTTWKASSLLHQFYRQLIQRGLKKFLHSFKCSNHLNPIETTADEIICSCGQQRCTIAETFREALQIPRGGKSPPLTTAARPPDFFDLPPARLAVGRGISTSCNI